MSLRCNDVGKKKKKNKMSEAVGKRTRRVWSTFDGKTKRKKILVGPRHEGTGYRKYHTYKSIMFHVFCQQLKSEDRRYMKVYFWIVRDVLPKTSTEINILEMSFTTEINIQTKIFPRHHSSVVDGLAVWMGEDYSSAAVKTTSSTKTRDSWHWQN